MSIKSNIVILTSLALASCAGIGVPYSPSGLAIGVDRDAVRLNDAHTRAINGVIVLNIIRARDGWPTGYTTLSGIQFTPEVELDLTGNFAPLGLGNPPLPFGTSNATIERDERSNATYSVNPFADEEGASGLYNVEGTEEVFERFVNAGWPIEVIFPLMVRSITVNKKTCVIEGRSDGELRTMLEIGKSRNQVEGCWRNVRDIFTTNGEWTYGLRTENDDWDCNILMNKDLLIDPQEGMGSRIAAINSAATGEDGKISSRVLIESNGVKLCSRKSNTDKTLFVKVEAADTKKPIFDDIKFRSFDDMIYFVGETIRGNKQNSAENKLCVENCFNTSKSTKKRYLFKVEENPILHRNHAVEVVHAGSRYTTLEAGLRKNSDFDDRSGTVLAILSQMLLLNQSEAFLEAPENILLQ